MRLKVSVRIRQRCYHPHLRGAGRFAAAGLLQWAAPAANAQDAPVASAWATQADLERIGASSMVGEGRREAGGEVVVEVFGPADALASLPGFRSDHRRRAPPEGYRDPAEADAALRALPGYVLLGRSALGRPIGGVWLGQPAGSGAPTLRILGGHHGDEWPSAELALVLAETLAAGEDDRIDAILGRASVLVVPQVNPDGVDAGSRYNARDVDLNRNYGFEWTGAAFGGAEPFSEPETRAIRTMALLSPPAAGLSLHAGAENIGYPWNWTTDPAPDEAALVASAERYAAECTRAGFSVIQGAAWYVTHGDTNDWSYGSQGAFDYTVEVSAEKSPSPDEIEGLVADHLDAMLAWLALELPVGGRVFDAATGDPIGATLSIDGGPSFPSDPASGAFWRAAGGGSLRVEAPGYTPAEVAPGADLAVALARHRLAPVAAVRVRDGDRLVFDGPDGAYTLVRPGVEPVPFELISGEAEIGALVPGPWTVVDGSGAAWPNAVFGSDDGIRLTGAARIGAEVVIDGVAFGPGSRAFALWGDARPLIELPLVEEDDRELVFDGSALPEEGRVDLVVVSAGSAQAVLDLEGAADVDDRAVVPAPARLASFTPEGLPRGCATASASPALALLALATTRRARRRGARGAS